MLIGFLLPEKWRAIVAMLVRPRVEKKDSPQRHGDHGGRRGEKHGNRHKNRLRNLISTFFYVKFSVHSVPPW
jgi:hypothetical protein